MSKQFSEINVGVSLLVLSIVLIAGLVIIQNSLDGQYKQQQLLVAAQSGRLVLEEFGYIFATRTLEQSGSISPTDANLIGIDAVIRLSHRSERMVILAKSFNNTYIQHA